jgi:NitT/TauT family transport system substrate-binding protein
VTRVIRVLIISLITTLLCPGCGKDNQPATEAKLAKVTLQLNWKAEPQFGGFYAAEVDDTYRKHGLDVTITAGGAGAPTVEMIGAGTVPFAIVSADEIVRARANSNPVVALFAVYQTNPQAIMTRASRGLKSLANLFSSPGTLAMERGLPYSDFLEKKYGFQRLKIVPSPFGDLTLYRTEENYAMQCFITSEPLAANRIGIEPQTFLIAESGYNPYTTVLATSESYLKANPEIVQSMVAAVREGWQAYLNDPTKANESMGKLNQTMDAQTFKDSAEAQKPLIQSPDTEKLGLGAMTLTRWETLVQQLIELKVIDQPVAPESCFVEPAKAK